MYLAVWYVIWDLQGTSEIKNAALEDLPVQKVNEYKERKKVVEARIQKNAWPL